MTKSNKSSPEVRERAVRMVQGHRGDCPSLWAAVESTAPKIGCVPNTLHEWVKKAEVDSAQRPGTSTSDCHRIKELEREVKQLRRANDILKLASAFFAQAELDRHLKKCNALLTSTAIPLRGRAHLSGATYGPIVLLASCSTPTLSSIAQLACPT